MMFKYPLFIACVIFGAGSALACPSDKPFLTYRGQCVSCDSDDGDVDKTPENCGVCDGSNNTSHKKREIINNECTLTDIPISTVDVLNYFSSITLHEDGTITVVPINEETEPVHLQKSEAYTTLSDRHIHRSVIFMGMQDDGFLKFMRKKYSRHRGRPKREKYYLVTKPYTLSEFKEKNALNIIKNTFDDVSIQGRCYRKNFIHFLPELIQHVKKNGTTDGELLQLARDKEIFQILLDNNVNINALSKDGKSVLMTQIELPRFDLYSDKVIENFKLLVQNGADVSIKNNDGKTIFDLVTEKIKETKDKIKENQQGLPSTARDEKTLNAYREIVRMLRP